MRRAPPFRLCLARDLTPAPLPALSFASFILSAALDASAQFFVFITTFALFGAGNGVRPFPPSCSPCAVC